MATDQRHETDTQPDAIETCAADAGSEQLAQPARREFIGRSGKLLIYTPPVIQLFIPTRALAASPSS